MTTISGLPAAAAAFDNDAIPTQQIADGVSRNFKMLQFWNYISAKISAITGQPLGLAGLDAFGNASSILVKPNGGTSNISLGALAASVTPSLLPTSLPALSGVIWNNNGILCIS